jgi:hypothetical protein
MAQRGARCRGSPEVCGREGGRRRDALAAKGLRTLPKPLYRACVQAHRPFHSRINPSLLPHARPCGKCPTMSSSFRLAQELRHHGRAPESMHGPSGLRSTRVPLFWRHARPSNMTSRIKCDRSCRRAALHCLAVPCNKWKRCQGTTEGYYRCSRPGVPAPVAWPAP